MFYINRKMFRIDRKIQNIVLAITILLIAYACGENNAKVGAGGGLPAVTPIDNISDSSLLGTYTIKSFSKKGDNGEIHVYNGDNVTGELTIDFSSIRYRFQYDDGKSSYYTYNLDDFQDPWEQRALRNSIKNGTDGNGIKSDRDIVFNNFGATKISNEIKDLKAYDPEKTNYKHPYKHQLTDVWTKNADGTVTWATEGTYWIEEIFGLDSSNTIKSYRPKGSEDWIISFKKDKDKNTCEGLSFYQVTNTLVNEFPYDPSVSNPCSIFFNQAENRLEIGAGGGATHLKYYIHKMYDTVRF